MKRKRNGEERYEKGKNEYGEGVKGEKDRG